MYCQGQFQKLIAQDHYYDSCRFERKVCDFLRLHWHITRLSSLHPIPHPPLFFATDNHGNLEYLGELELFTRCIWIYQIINF